MAIKGLRSFKCDIIHYRTITTTFTYVMARKLIFDLIKKPKQKKINMIFKFYCLRAPNDVF